MRFRSLKRIAAPIVSDFRRHLSWLPVIMAILLMVATASAERPERDVALLGSSATVLAADEPITPIPAAQEDPRKVALGERLFHDPRLSHGDTRACASCHDTSTNGASANRHDTAMDGTALTFNTNTVFNAAL